MTTRLRILICVGLPALVLGLVAFLHWDRIGRRIGAVREGVLYRSATLTEERLEELVRKKGIRTILNLRNTDLDTDRRVAERHGARYLRLPSKQVPRPDQIARFLEIMDDPENHPVLIHCMHGVGRTGVYAAVFRMEYDGWSADDAIEEAQDYAMGGSFQPGQEKEVFLRAHRARTSR